MAKKYRIVYDRQNCIGAVQCVAVMPEFWVLDSDGKATLKGSKNAHDQWELEIDEKNLAKMKDAAASCPVNVIHIIDTKTGQRIV